MAMFVWLTEIGDGPRRLVNLDQVKSTYPQEGYTSVRFDEDQTIAVRETQEQIADLITRATGKAPPRAY